MLERLRLQRKNACAYEFCVRLQPDLQVAGLACRLQPDNCSFVQIVICTSCDEFLQHLGTDMSRQKLPNLYVVRLNKQVRYSRYLACIQTRYGRDQA
jgi:hypothetical protein